MERCSPNCHQTQNPWPWHPKHQTTNLHRPRTWMHTILSLSFHPLEVISAVSWSDRNTFSLLFPHSVPSAGQYSNVQMLLGKPFACTSSSTGCSLPECDISSKTYGLCGETMSSGFPKQLCPLIVPPERRDNADGPNTYTNLSTSEVQGLAGITQVKSRLYKVRGQGWRG